MTTQPLHRHLYPHFLVLFDIFTLFELTALGLTAGFLAGLLGIGGGMIMVPFLNLILVGMNLNSDLAMKSAIATAMSTIVFTSLSSVRAHHQKGGVQWPLVAKLVPGIFLGGMLASMGVFSLVKGSVLAIVFGGFVGFSALQMWRKNNSKDQQPMPGTLGMLGAGSLIGLISGLVGAGGGFLSVPFMVKRQVPVHQAVATSAALGFPIALSNTVGFVIGGWGLTGLTAGHLGFVWLPGLLVIAAGSVVTAPLGASMAHSLNVAQLRKVFAVLLMGLSVYMLCKGLTSMQV